MLRRMWHCALLPLLVASVAPAETGTWTALGPEGGSLQALAVDPDDREITYVVAQGNVLHRRLEPSAPWEFALTRVEAIATAAGGRVYAGGFGNVYRSQDHGGTFARASVGSVFIEALAADPSDADTVYAATRPFTDAAATGIYRSNDGGRSWTAISEALPPTEQVLGFFVDPTSPSTLRIAFRDDTVWQSEDGGVTWAPTEEGLPCDAEAPCLTSFATLPGVPPTLLVGTDDHGIFRSTDGGAHWTASAGGGNGVVSAIAGDAEDAMSAYAVTDGGALAPAGTILRSADAGATWQPTASAPDRYVTALAVTNRALSAATRVGFYQSDDAGESWQLDESGLNATCSFSIAAAATPQTTLYTGVTANGVVVGPDRAGEWTSARLASSSWFGAAVALDPNDPLRSFAATYAGPAISSDGGATYAPVSEEPFFYHALVVDPQHGDVLYAAARNNEVMKSSDAGRTWSVVLAADTVGQIRDIAADPASGRIFALFANALLTSRNDGTTWEQVLHTSSASNTFHSVDVAPTSPPTLFVDGTDGVLGSYDGGRRWQPLPFPGNTEIINDVAIDPSRARTVYATNAAAGGDQVYRSDDAGVTWRPVGDPFEGLISQLAVDPHDGSIVYATICGRGVHMLTQDAAPKTDDTDACQISAAPKPNPWVLAAHGMWLALLLAVRRGFRPALPR